MGRFILSQLRYARGRSLTLAAGILVAAVSFTLLTATVTTSRLEAQETLDRNFRGAYDLLVRPPASASDVEREQDLVAPDHLSGIFGGITRQQYETIKAIPGVEVAAPIANIGYLLNERVVPVELEHVVQPEGPQLYRVSSRFPANNGQSTYPGREAYLYYTPDHPLEFVHTHSEVELASGDPVTFTDLARVLQDGTSLAMCSAYEEVGGQRPRLYDRGATELDCFGSDGGEARQTPRVPATDPAVGRILRQNYVASYPPVLLAAVDPEQEARLVGLDGAVVGGRYLESSDTDQRPSRGEELPVLVSTDSSLDQSMEVTVERLQVPDLTQEPFRLPPGSDVTDLLASQHPPMVLRELPGREVDRKVLAPDAIHEYALGDRGRSPFSPEASADDRVREAAEYVRTSPVTYRSLGEGRLAAVADTENPTRDDAMVWTNPHAGSRGFLKPPPGNEDVRYRDLTMLHADTSPGLDSEAGERPWATMREVGRFDPELLTQFNPYTRLPLETYHPPEIVPADDASRGALGDQPLRPTHNLGGYVGQPAVMLTTMDAMAPLVDSEWYLSADGARGSEKAPIGVIRVRLEGITGVGKRSQERLRRAAEAIHLETGLQVDIVVGASPTPMQVELPAGNYGRPPLVVEEGWVKKRAAVVISEAVDRKSAALFPLVLVACGLFLANAAFAAVRARRRELGTLRCLGWSARQVFTVVLGELVVAGLAAGVLGTLLAVTVARVAELNLPARQAPLVIPVAVLLALAAGFPPAWQASRGSPLDAVRPPVLGAQRRRAVRGLPTMALRNLGRVPGRTLLGSVSLAIGTAALTVLLAINLGFQGVVAGTLLGDLLATQVRAVDYVAVGLVTLLGAASVADVLVLNLRERAAEALTLSTTGWSDAHLTYLAWLEGAGMGLLGAGVGAGTGLVVAAQLGPGGSVAGLVLATGLAAFAGLAVVLLVLLVALRGLWRLPPPTVLAQE